MPLQEFIERHWDAVIVGTGMGGAVTGYELARAGRSVLFVEKGAARSPHSLTGRYAETFFDAQDVAGPQHRATLCAAGREWSTLQDASSDRAKRFTPFVGSGAGGSTALYGMALERFFPGDFESWPISYEELAPFYAQAERLFRVRGGRDPLRPADATALLPAPPLTPSASELFRHLEGKGLHPYRLPMACEFVADCATCQGFLCMLRCKNDAATTCLEPALREHGARLVDRCEVHQLQASANQVTALECSRNGNRFVLRGRTIVLAAGALSTPALLLRSVSAAWPGGLANRSELVGRNLMRHLVDLYAVGPLSAEPTELARKELAFSDFYMHDGVKLGAVQSFGRLPPASILAAQVRKDLVDAYGTWTAGPSALAAPFVKGLLERMLRRSALLAGVVEDLAYPDNAVTLAPDGATRIRYRLQPEAMRRVKLHRALVRRALHGYRVRLLRQAHNNAQLAHACGTCRFGEDARTSVLDRNNRAHDVENLYIVDSSFFPSSAGTNPALTIAANALRVAKAIAEVRT